MQALVSRILDIRWGLFIWLLSLNRSKSFESLSSEQKVQSRYDLEWRFKELDLDRGAEQLRYLLRSYPYWARGHYHFAEIMLVRGDIEAAYGAALAFRNLSRTAKSSEVSYLLGRCYLRAGDLNSAIEQLELAAQISSGDPAILEELAAAYLAVDRNEHALNTLQKIPSANLNQSAHAAILALKAKI